LLPYLRITIEDHDGNAAVSLCYLPDDVSSPSDSRITSLTTAIQAGTVGALNQIELSLREFISASPTEDVYDAIDRAVLVYTSASPTVQKIVVSISAPHPSLFTDGEAVDPSSSILAAINASVIGFVCDRYGSPAETYVTGYRDRW